MISNKGCERLQTALAHRSISPVVLGVIHASFENIERDCDLVDQDALSTLISTFSTEFPVRDVGNLGFDHELDWNINNHFYKIDALKYLSYIFLVLMVTFWESSTACWNITYFGSWMLLFRFSQFFMDDFPASQVRLPQIGVYIYIHLYVYICVCVWNLQCIYIYIHRLHIF